MSILLLQGTKSPSETLGTGASGLSSCTASAVLLVSTKVKAPALGLSLDAEAWARKKVREAKKRRYKHKSACLLQGLFHQFVNHSHCFYSPTWETRVFDQESMLTTRSIFIGDALLTAQKVSSTKLSATSGLTISRPCHLVVPPFYCHLRIKVARGRV